MRWGLRASSRQQPREAQHPRRVHHQQQDSKEKRKAGFSSFSPLAWLSKLTARTSGGAAVKPEQATPASASAKSASPQATVSSPPNFRKLASRSPASASQSSSAGSSSSAAAASGRAPLRGTANAAVAADIAPRRRSVGNEDTESDATAAARHLYRRRPYSVGGDRDLPPLGHLISFPAKPPPAPAPVRTLAPTLPPLPSDTDDEKRRRSSRRRPRRAGGRRSFSSGKAPGARVAAAVRVRSPRPGAAAVSELERFAVVRQTRDPQREFRASMVEMIASKRMGGRPEELETLLACYLSLNADEHHDCIVKVFRQVWFELNNSATAQAATSRRG